MTDIKHRVEHKSSETNPIGFVVCVALVAAVAFGGTLWLYDRFQENSASLYISSNSR